MRTFFYFNAEVMHIFTSKKHTTALLLTNDINFSNLHHWRAEPSHWFHQ